MFVPVAFIAGAARSLFVPLALGVVIAMLTSYLLSRTLVPTLVRSSLAHEESAAPAGWLARNSARFDAQFERLRAAYGGVLEPCLARPGLVLSGFAVFVALSLALSPLLGRDFFPALDAGLIRLHVRSAPGTRIEESERLYAELNQLIRDVIPEREIEDIIDNIGVTGSPINLSMTDGTMISSADGEILIALKHGHGRTADYVRALRRELNQRFPEAIFFFLAPDLATQVLNFGISAPIDLQLRGPTANVAQNLALAQQLERDVRAIPGVVDARVHQVPATPNLHVEINRDLASKLGLTQRDVASDLLLSLSSSGQTAPNFWLDPKKGVQYTVAVQTPQHRMDSLHELGATPLGLSDSGAPQLLANVASYWRGSGPSNVSHYNGLPTYDVLANVADTDLGSVA